MPAAIVPHGAPIDPQPVVTVEADTNAAVGSTCTHAPLHCW
jgi:hypothetical protein